MLGKFQVSSVNYKIVQNNKTMTLQLKHRQNNIIMEEREGQQMEKHIYLSRNHKEMDVQEYNCVQDITFLFFAFPI